MELQHSRDLPTIMHIDLNSCFASVEQQANPFLRGRPVGVAAYTGDSGCVISPSYEAKRMGVKVGFRVRDARALCPEIIILPPDPPKYRAVHQMFCRLFREYAPVVVPKSIDEAVLDFKGTEVLKKDIPGLIETGYEIKYRMKKEIGDWLTCNVGISTNMFLAKTAASLHKPDGLDVITYENVREVFSELELMDLCGINTRFDLRLRMEGIRTPLEFYNATYDILRKKVFKSIVGYHWYARLRGWETDKYDHPRRTYGQSYALHHWTGDIDELSRLLLKLCEKMGRRVRTAGYYAHGIHVGCLYMDGEYWHIGRKSSTKLYTTLEFYTAARKYLASVKHKKVTHIFVSCYDLRQIPEHFQLELFDRERERKWKLTHMMDTLNDRYGEYVVIPAMMMGMQEEIIDRVPFGGVKDLEQLYRNPNL